mgnify:CR=1 FL=1
MTGTIDAPSVLPNTSMVRKQNLKNQFTASQMFSTYLSDSSNTDSHIMKNTEWGAMAYLSQSIYGKYGNSNYTGANKGVYKNTSTATGRSTGSYTGESYVCVYNNIADRGNGTGSCGGGASTTGNITGIYDASGDQGGVYEFTMGYYAGAKDTQIWTNAGFTEPLEAKYTNAYMIKISNGVIRENAPPVMGEVHGIDLQRLADLFFPPFVCLCLFMRFDLFIEKGKSHRLLALLQNCRNHIPPGCSRHIADIYR